MPHVYLQSRCSAVPTALRITVPPGVVAPAPELVLPTVGVDAPPAAIVARLALIQSPSQSAIYFSPSRPKSTRLFAGVNLYIPVYTYQANTLYLTRGTPHDDTQQTG